MGKDQANQVNKNVELNFEVRIGPASSILLRIIS